MIVMALFRGISFPLLSGLSSTRIYRSFIPLFPICETKLLGDHTWRRDVRNSAEIRSENFFRIA